MFSVITLLLSFVGSMKTFLLSIPLIFASVIFFSVNF